MKKYISAAAAAAMLASLVPAYSVRAQVSAELASVSFKYGDKEYSRQMEKLDRGLIAVNTDNGVYIGWRLLGDECSVSDIKNAPTFDVYKNGKMLAEVVDSTNYLDVSGTKGDSYSVAIHDSDELCSAVSVNDSPYYNIRLDRPSAYKVDDETSYEYTVGDCSTGDLDGDGQYEIVVKWDSNPQDNSKSGITGNVLLDAYKMDGTKMWRIDLGRNIRAGAHYTQFLVYDFDQDGKGEITCKTAPGSKDAKGNYVSDASSVDAIKNTTNNETSYVNDGGYILEGDEYFTAFDGETGAALDTIYYPVQRISAAVWGDTYGNRVDRFVADVAYLDGEKPYAVYWRGYYFGSGSQRTGICAMSLDENKKLNCEYCFDTYDTSSIKSYKGVHGYTEGNERYVGQGNHNMTAADVDNDGRDEFISGAMCMEVNDDNKLMPRWCTFKGHGDALHIGDYDPTHKGLEFYTVHEDGGGTDSVTGQTLDYGQSVIDPDTGEIIWHMSASSDTGRGIMANVGAGGYYQVNSSNAGTYISNGGNHFTAATLGMSVNFRIFWDADLYEELLDGTGITSWNGSGMSRIFNADGCISINGTKANPALQADLFGDWREEVCYPTEDNENIRIYTSTEVTSYKLPTLMHDPIYRSGVAAEQSAYNQPPHAGFYISEDIYRADLIGIEVIVPDKTEYNVGDKADWSGLRVTGSCDDGTNYEIENYSITGFDSMRAGEQNITVSCGGFSKSFTVNVNTDFTADASGMITGYLGESQTAIIPNAINDIEIRGIADNALDGTKLKKLYIYDNIEAIGENSFEGITICCYEGSFAHIYALENNISFELTERGHTDYLFNVTFDEDEYSGFAIIQSNQTKTLTRGSITYTVGGRSRGGDGHTGFNIDEAEGNSCLRAAFGRFATGNRNPYMTFSDVPMLANDYDCGLSFKLMFPQISYNGEQREAYLRISDYAGVVDEVSKDSLGAEYDTWYNYSIVYHDGSYYRILSDAPGSEISMTRLNAAPSDMGISRIDVLSKTGLSNNADYAYLYIDDLNTYTTEAALGNISFMTVDEKGKPVEEVKIKLGNTELVTDEDGYASAIAQVGIYSAEITADGYEPQTVFAALYDREYLKKITLKQETVNAQGVLIDKENAAVAVGDSISLKAKAIPENATDDSFVWSSSDENIARVDQSGVVTGVSEGTADIAVDLKGFRAVCTVKVYDTSRYEQTPAAIEVTASSDSAVIPPHGVNKTTEITAVVYDEKGVEIKNSDVELSCDKAELKDGYLYITSSMEAGDINITASLGDISDFCTVKLTSMLENADIYVNTTYDEAADLKLPQATENMEETRGDITYGSGSRGSSVDPSIGVWGAVDDNGVYLKAGSGAWSSANRYSYMVFNKDPKSYNSEKQYVFETDICFDKTSQTPITAENGIVISKYTLDAEPGKWYHYALAIEVGIYTQYVFDEDNNLLSVKKLDNSSTDTISKLGFGVNGETGKVYLDNTRYYQRDNAVSNLTVKVYDKDGNPMDNVNVSIGAVSETTNSLGRAKFKLINGVYTVEVSPKEGPSLERDAVLNGDGSVKIIYDDTKISPDGMSYKFNSATDGKNIKSDLTAYDTMATTVNKTIYTAFYEGGRLVGTVSKETVQKDNISLEAAIPANADTAVSMAWNNEGEPISQASRINLK